MSTGLANSGVARVIRDNRRYWAQSPAPIVLHVAAVSPDDVIECCAIASEVDEVSAIELGLPDEGSQDALAELVEAALASAVQPVIVRVPYDHAIDIAPRVLTRMVEDSGASAVSVTSPPRGSLYHASAGRVVSGSLYGPFVLPLVLERVARVVERVSLPVIGCGGVWEADDARAMLRAGCVAVQVDAVMFRDPTSPGRITQALR